MSVASIDYSLEETGVEGHDRDVVDGTGRLDRRAGMRRPFTPTSRGTGRTARQCDAAAGRRTGPDAQLGRASNA
jgi:hypothetical protein